MYLIVLREWLCWSPACVKTETLRWKSAICSMFCSVWFSDDLTQFDRMFFCRRWTHPGLPFSIVCHILQDSQKTSPFGGIVTKHPKKRNTWKPPQQASWLASVSTDPMVPARMYICLKLWTKEVTYIYYIILYYIILYYIILYYIILYYIIYMYLFIYSIYICIYLQYIYICIYLFTVYIYVSIYSIYIYVSIYLQYIYVSIYSIYIYMYLFTVYIYMYLFIYSIYIYVSIYSIYIYM